MVYVIPLVAVWLCDVVTVTPSSGSKEVLPTAENSSDAPFFRLNTGSVRAVLPRSDTLRSTGYEMPGTIPHHEYCQTDQDLPGVSSPAIY